MSNYIYTNEGLVNVDELTHYGVPGMRWGRPKKTIGLKEVLGTRKLNKYKERAANEQKFANTLAKEQRVMNDPKSWQKGQYNESYDNALKAAKYSKKLTKKYEDAGLKWIEANSAIQKMNYSDARKAKDLYRKTVDEVYELAGYRIIG